VLNDLEQIVAAQIIEFEREIARTFRGIAPRNFEQTLSAVSFLQVLRDLSTFVVELWDVDKTHVVASSLDQQSSRSHSARACSVAVVPDAIPISAPTKGTQVLLTSQIRRLVELPYGS